MTFSFEEYIGRVNSLISESEMDKARQSNIGDAQIAKNFDKSDFARYFKYDGTLRPDAVRRYVIRRTYKGAARMGGKQGEFTPQQRMKISDEVEKILSNPDEVKKFEDRLKSKHGPEFERWQRSGKPPRYSQHNTGFGAPDDWMKQSESLKTSDGSVKVGRKGVSDEVKKAIKSSRGSSTKGGPSVPVGPKGFGGSSGRSGGSSGGSSDGGSGGGRRPKSFASAAPEPPDRGVTDFADPPERQKLKLNVGEGPSKAQAQAMKRVASKVGPPNKSIKLNKPDKSVKLSKDEIKALGGMMDVETGRGKKRMGKQGPKPKSSKIVKTDSGNILTNDPDAAKKLDSSSSKLKRKPTPKTPPKPNRSFLRIPKKASGRAAVRAAGAVPIIGNLVDIGSAIYRASKGDMTGAGLSLGSAIPGPVGYGFTAADIARDAKKGFVDTPKTAPTKPQIKPEVDKATQVEPEKLIDPKARKRGGKVGTALGLGGLGLAGAGIIKDIVGGRNTGTGSRTGTGANTDKDADSDSKTQPQTGGPTGTKKDTKQKDPKKKDPKRGGIPRGRRNLDLRKPEFKLTPDEIGIATGRDFGGSEGRSGDFTSSPYGYSKTT